MDSLRKVYSSNYFSNPAFGVNSQRKLSAANSQGASLNCGLTIFANFFITEQYSCEFGSAKFFALCGFGGILSCGLTHTAVVPLDLVKCRIQVIN